MSHDATSRDQGDIKTAPRPRADWSTENIESLLMIRYSSLAKSKFNACQTNKQKTAWWAWLTARLNVHINSNFTQKQVKNKFTALKAEYRSLVAAEMETGNAENKMRYPEYWECLLECMQSQSGLHRAPLADSFACHDEDLLHDTGNDQSDESQQNFVPATSQKKETNVVALKPEKNKSLGECLVQGMGSMAQAMIEVAKLQKCDNNGNGDLAPILDKIDKRLQEQSAINQAILRALEGLRNSQD
ncbi:hypothetical protein AC1031_021665 [Aphanomyces cochlioides]|nr:hypothetical protein AC1031_021665 [Aphanomyces cochlioides]